MQATLNGPTQGNRWRNRYTLPLVVGGLLLVFFLAPWPMQHKASAALHGLCAQTPSHTFRFGDRPLPFDSRMSGIYGGFIVSFLYLIARGRHRAAKLPGVGVMAVLALLVGALAVDGFNSLFLDLDRPHPYSPDNRIRVLTGAGTGIALAVILCFLCAATFWRRPDATQRIAGWRDLAVLLPLQAPFILLVLTGPEALWFPTAMLLILAAVTAVSTLALVSIVLIRRLDFTFDGFSELQTMASAAIVTAVVIMGALSAGRFFLEDLLGLPPLT